MDTKSKSNKTLKHHKKKAVSGIFPAIILILAADFTFLFQYPNFKERASVEEPDILSGSEFLHEIYQANAVLYKQLREAVEGKNLSSQDIYLTAEGRNAEDVAEYYDFGEETPLTYAGKELDTLLEDWDLSLQEGLAKRVDYQIIDQDSQKIFANTERDLSMLGTENAKDALKSYYPYYIKMQFDEGGLLEHVWVRGENADGLLKSVQRVMRSRYLERSLYERLSYSPFGGIDWEDSIYYGKDNDVCQMRLHVVNTPKNCIVCYALTEVQYMQVREASQLFPALQTAGNYYNSGIQQFFYVLLMTLGIAAFMLPLWKGYRLHERFAMPLHMESIIILLFVCFLLFGELSAGMVQCTMTEHWAYSLPHAIRSLFPGIPLFLTNGIVFAINLFFLTAAFTLWFTLVTVLAQVYLFGLRKYLKKRCFCLRIYRCLRVLTKREKTRFTRELKHLNLEENGNVPLFKLIAVNYVILAFISLFWIFGVLLLLIYSIVLYICLKKYMQYIQEKYACMLGAVRSVAAGNLQTEFTGDWGLFESLKNQMQEIQSGFSKAVEEEVKSQRMRTELITNVSHDLKTPLTAIITYTELLQEENVTESQRREYLEVLKRKSFRLKVLIEDLFEVSKANSGNVTFHKSKVDICHLMRQVYLEYEDRAESAGLIFRFAFPEEKMFLMLDGEKTSRIFDNLYNNIIKYAMPNTRVYISVLPVGDDVSIELKNISGTELNVPVESLTERFVRGDSSRSSEGSGLGLAIARSFVELQNGKMQIEIDGDLFKITLIWKTLSAIDLSVQ